MDDLQGISIDFVDGETNLNFAEAVLLIQLRCIYSKKVEFSTPSSTRHGAGVQRK